jgi:hypothetical protein
VNDRAEPVAPPAATGELVGDAALVACFSRSSPRLGGASLAVMQLAEAMAPYVSHAVGQLRAFEAEHVREGASGDRAPVDFSSHFLRYVLNLALVRHRAGIFRSKHGRPMRILDVGGLGIVSEELVRDDNLQLHRTSGDLRRRFELGTCAAYDLVLCTEVVEHVCDPELGFVGDPARDYNAEVSAVGVLRCLERLALSLTSEAALYLTTPNALSLYALRELGNRRPAAIYRPHYREYTPRELFGLLGAAGLDALLTTVEVYPFYDYSAEVDFLEKVGAPDARRFRGDTIACFAGLPRRSAESREIDARYLEVLVRVTGREAFAPRGGLDALIADRLG